MVLLANAKNRDKILQSLQHFSGLFRTVIYKTSLKAGGVGAGPPVGDDMYLSGLIQRDKLFDLTLRWFSNWVEPSDGRFLTEVFIYESLISSPVCHKFLTDILRVVYPEPYQLRRASTKDEVRQAIINSCPDPTPHIKALLEQYRALPEEFFPRTPVDLMMVIGMNNSLLGITRVKRIRRVAEKASRRVADRLAGVIVQSAQSLAELRAEAAGVSLSNLLSPPEVMAEEFAVAERIISQSFRDRQIAFEPPDLNIDDIIGSKFIGNEEELSVIEEAIRSYPGATLVEKEVHTGDYNATNLLIDLDLPAPSDIIDRFAGHDWSIAAGRGLDPSILAADFPDYIESSSRTFRTEVILTTFDEMVESEFGRSIHEERVLDQRGTSSYAGRIATNASFIIEYMLMLAMSPTVAVPPLPVKMWGRYLPETFSKAVWGLFGIDQGMVLWDSYLLDLQDTMATFHQTGTD